jgi:hypothetical protein
MERTGRHSIDAYFTLNDYQLYLSIVKYSNVHTNLWSSHRSNSLSKQNEMHS